MFGEPLLTTELPREDFVVPSDASYVFGSGLEDRSRPGREWKDDMTAQGVAFIRVDEDHELGTIRMVGEGSAIPPSDLQLRNRAELAAFAESAGDVYLDITGMSYNAWAPLLRAFLGTEHKCHVVYVEPIDYRRSAAPARGMLFDLSEGIEGIAPLPGFATITRRRRRDEPVLVPLLGFEGTRLAHVLRETEPTLDRVVPIVGLPGFRPEFPSQALIGNRTSLDEGFLFSKVRFAKANCPFDLFHMLHEIQADFAAANLRIAPVGTKPHGLGAVLYALSRGSQVEIVYDHPKRKAKRTTGEARICLYDVGTFSESDLFKGVGNAP
jgi:hypothetical protein